MTSSTNGFTVAAPVLAILLWGSVLLVVLACIGAAVWIHFRPEQRSHAR